MSTTASSTSSERSCAQRRPRDPNGAGLELYNEEVGVFNGVRLIDP